MSQGWIGVDLDGTLVEYGKYQGPTHIGAPIPRMVERVKRWLAEERDVRIFTARVFYPQSADLSVTTADYLARKQEATLAREAINAFTQDTFGVVLPVTNVKDYEMIELWDDRAVQVIKNTGLRADGLPG